MPPTNDRRRDTRFSPERDLRLFLGSQQTELRGRVMDLSAGGMRLHAPEVHIASSVTLQLHLALANGRGATATARAARGEGGDIVFHFQTASAGDRDLFGSASFWREDGGIAALYIAPIDTPRWWERWWTPIAPSAAAA